MHKSSKNFKTNWQLSKINKNDLKYGGNKNI